MPKVIDLPTSTSMSDSDYLIMEASGGGTKKITRANAISSDSFVRCYYKDGATSTTTVSTTETTIFTVPSRTYKAGTYTVIFRATPVSISNAGDAGQGYLNLGGSRRSAFSPISHLGGTGTQGDLMMVFTFTLTASVTGALSISLLGSASKTFTFPAYTDCLCAGWTC